MAGVAGQVAVRHVDLAQDIELESVNRTVLVSLKAKSGQLHPAIKDRVPIVRISHHIPRSNLRSPKKQVDGRRWVCVK